MDSSVDFYTMSSRTIGISKKRTEDGDGRSNTTECDSTTEPASQKMNIVVGDDVFYQEDSGQNVLGTVGLIQGKKVKIIFLDDSEKWAHISKIKKFSFPDESVIDDKSNSAPSPDLAVQQPTVEGGISGALKKKCKGEMNGHNTPKENMPVTCGSCGTQKMIASKKALEFSPYTHHQYNCRKCINKSKTSKNNGVHIPISHILAASKGRPKGTDNVTMSKSMLDGIPCGSFRQQNETCLHCRFPITEKVRLRCTMCERPCHSSCLALTPPPLAGDIFWSIICHVCGTQKPDGSPENDSHKLYSSRRNISSWSDVAYLLLMCLGCKYSNQRFFDLDLHILPFWEDNASRLHLPRQYKSKEPSERKLMLEGALKNANLRFYTDDDSKAAPLWAIKEPSMIDQMNVMAKPSSANGNRGVTAAGFPISVRTSNPEVASAAMSNIAQTIAVNKVVPSPKNSPSLTVSKPVIVKQNSTTTANIGPVATVKKGLKLEHHSNVAKKSGSEVNFGAAPPPRSIWNQQSRMSKSSFLTETPKASPNGLTTREDVVHQLLKTPVKSGPGNSVSQSHKNVLTPSPGGAARVTGMVISSTISSASVPPTNTDVTSRSNNVSYPVRKNGSPMLNRSIRVEPLDSKREGNMSPQRHGYSYHTDSYRRSEQHDLIRESPGFNNSSQPKPVMKRKFSPGAPGDGSYTRVLDKRVEIDSEAKKIKMSLPTSTDITSQRVPSPTKSSEVLESPKYTSEAKSPLQKLSDLEKKGLSISRVGPSESGGQTQRERESSMNVLRLSHEKYDTLPSTPIKLNGASVKESVDVDMLDVEITKDNTNHVTTSPRAFKLASVTSPGIKPPQSLADRKLPRPQRLKRSVVANAQAVKQSKETEKKVNAKSNSATATAAAAIVSKVNRGRPKKPYGHKFVPRKPSGGMAYNIGQFNGPVQSEANESSNSTMLESDYSWNNNTISDLLHHGGGGYRIGCLPKSAESKEEIVSDALKHLKDEVAPRPPSYWSSSSSRSKRPSFQKSKRDLKNVDSYYINGSRMSAYGLQYQVVWRDGYDFEYSTEDEEESGIEFSEESYLTFDSTTIDYILDNMPVEYKAKSDCDKGPAKSRDNYLEKTGLRNEVNNCAEDHPDVKKEPQESHSKSTTPIKPWSRQETAFIHMTPSIQRNAAAPPCIDLTAESP